MNIILIGLRYSNPYIRMDRGDDTKPKYTKAGWVKWISFNNQLDILGFEEMQARHEVLSR